MKITATLGKHLHDVHFGGNWTCSNLKDTLDGITLDEAVARIGNCNTIAALTFHIHYYIAAVLPVLEGGPLVAHDQYSYDVPDIRTEQEWQSLCSKVLSDAEALSLKIAGLEDAVLSEFFTDEKYGTYLRNLLGIVEHTHYHLGQIAILKKMLK